ncbi:YihY/virulence factor BrkB family protein [soil metagenome]
MKMPAWLKKPYEVTLKTVHTYGEIDGDQLAAAFAYYVIFSLVPLVALLLTVGSVFFSPEAITTAIQSFLPLLDYEQNFLWEGVKRLEKLRGGVSIVSIVVLAWSSIHFFQALVRGVNRAWHTVEIPWWQLPLKNLLMIIITGGALFAGLLIPALLQGLRDALIYAQNIIVEHFPTFNVHAFSRLLDLGRYALGAAVLFYSFALLYMLAPRWRVRFSSVWLPSAIVTVALIVCQIAFVNYLPRFVNYSDIYGPFVGIMMLMLWIYLSGAIILFGGCLCASMAKHEGFSLQPSDPIPTPPQTAAHQSEKEKSGEADG